MTAAGSVTAGARPRDLFRAGPDSRAGSRVRRALADFAEGASRHEIWSSLAWQEIRKRYQRSVLGPFWITLTMLVMIGGMGPIYSILFRADVHEFLPFLALGLITWGLLSSIVLEGCTVFQQSDRMIQSVRLPLTVYVLRLIYSDVIIFFHNILAYVPVMLFFAIKPQWAWLLAIPGLMIIIIASIPTIFILGPLCSRFRDLQPIVGSVMQLLFFLTPIFWQPTALGEGARAHFINFNPFYLFVSVVRVPLLGGIPDKKIYIGVGLVTVVLYAIAVPVFARSRARVPFWV